MKTPRGLWSPLVIIASVQMGWERYGVVVSFCDTVMLQKEKKGMLRATAAL